MDRDGIYEASIREQSLRTVLKTEIDRLKFAFSLGDRGPTLVVMNGHTLELYAVTSNDDSIDLSVPIDRDRWQNIKPFPSVQLTSQDRLELPDAWFEAPDGF